MKYAHSSTDIGNLLLYVTVESEKVLVKNLFVCAGFVFTQVHLLI